jgi:structural maintenance of chromosome 3 (chondroitin sulfate proteoglycan 6)
MGLDSVARIARRLNLDGVYGPLYELFDVHNVYAKAADVTAGNRYFIAGL